MQKLERFLNWIASRQHGVVAREQLLAAGFTSRVIELRVASGALIPIHPGVYHVGHRAAAPHAHEAAAILACQPYASLNDRSAGGLLGPSVPEDPLVHVIVPGRKRRNLDGVRVHYISSLPEVDRTRRQGLPITAPALTLLDLAGSLHAHDAVSALNEARVQRLVTDADLTAVLERHPRRKGVRALRSLIAAERGPVLTESVAERMALRAMREAGITPPQRFVRDRRRAAYLAGRGVLVFALTWQDVKSPGVSMARLHSALASRRAA